MDLILLSLGTLVLAALCCMFYERRHQIYWLTVWQMMCFSYNLIGYHTHKDKHTEDTGTNRLTNTFQYILASPIMYTQQLHALHGMNNLLIQKFTLLWLTMSFLFKNCSLLEVIYLLLIFNKTKSFLWKTKNTDKNSINVQNTHNTLRKTI